MRWYVIFCLGALGGICPAVSKLAASFYTNPDQSLPVAGIYVAIGLFALLGGIIAIGFGAKEARAAIVAGIAAPAIVTNVLAGATENNVNREETMMISLVAPAYGQNAIDNGSTAVLADGLTIIVVPEIVQGGVPANATFPYSWSSSSGTILTSEPGQTIELSSPQILSVPAGAAEINVAGITVSLADLAASGNKLNLEITTQPTFAGDLRWALGGARKYVVETVNVAN